MGSSSVFASGESERCWGGVGGFRDTETELTRDVYMDKWRLQWTQDDSSVLLSFVNNLRVISTKRRGARRNPRVNTGRLWEHASLACKILDSSAQQQWSHVGKGILPFVLFKVSFNLVPNATSLKLAVLGSQQREEGDHGRLSRCLVFAAYFSFLFLVMNFY